MNGIEWSVPDVSVKGPDISYLDGALIVGRSGNTEAALDSAYITGLTTPRGNEWWSAKNVKFYSFAFSNGSSAIRDCSHCPFADSTDSGSRTITLSNLFFDSTVTKRVEYQLPFRGIFLDLDGTLTGLGANSWSVSHHEHN